MIAIDSSGNVWVSDETNNRIQEFSGTSPYSYIGNFTTLSGSGSPTGLFFDSNGYLWAADENSSPKAYQYQVNTSNGTATATGVTIGSGSAGIGTGTTPVELNGPQGIFIPSSR